MIFELLVALVTAQTASAAISGISLTHTSYISGLALNIWGSAANNHWRRYAVDGDLNANGDVDNVCFRHDDCDIEDQYWAVQFSVQKTVRTVVVINTEEATDKIDDMEGSKLIVLTDWGTKEGSTCLTVVNDGGSYECDLTGIGLMMKQPKEKCLRLCEIFAYSALNILNYVNPNKATQSPSASTDREAKNLITPYPRSGSIDRKPGSVGAWISFQFDAPITFDYFLLISTLDTDYGETVNFSVQILNGGSFVADCANSPYYPGGNPSGEPVVVEEHCGDASGDTFKISAVDPTKSLAFTQLAIFPKDLTEAAINCNGFTWNEPAVKVFKTDYATALDIPLGTIDGSADLDVNSCLPHITVWDSTDGQYNILGAPFSVDTVNNKLVISSATSADAGYHKITVKHEMATQRSLTTDGTTFDYVQYDIEVFIYCPIFAQELPQYTTVAFELFKGEETLDLAYLPGADESSDVCNLPYTINLPEELPSFMVYQADTHAVDLSRGTFGEEMLYEWNLKATFSIQIGTIEYPQFGTFDDEQFTLKIAVTNPCLTTTFNAEPMIDMEVFRNVTQTTSSLAEQEVPLHTDTTSDYCAETDQTGCCGPYVYDIYFGTPPKIATFADYYPKTSILKISTSDSNFVGSHLMTLDVYLEWAPDYVHHYTNFGATVFDVVEAESVFQNEPLRYVLKSTKVIKQFKRFEIVPFPSQNPNRPADYVLTYSLCLDALKLITFTEVDANLLEYSLFLDEKIDLSAYDEDSISVFITAKVTVFRQTSTMSTPWDLIIVPFTIVPPGTAPYFNEALKDVVLTVGQSWYFTLPEYFDDEGDFVQTKAEFDKARLFAVFSEEIHRFTISINATNIDMVGVYPIKVTLVDSSGLTTKYTFNLEITGGELTDEKKNKTEHLEPCSTPEGFTSPKFKITSASAFGLIQVEWSKGMTKPNNWDNLTMNATNSALEFTVSILTQKESEILFNWWFKDFDPHFVTFQLNFTNPFEVSGGGVPDRVQFQNMNCQNWADSEGFVLPLRYVDQRDLPRQMDLGMLGMIQSMGTSTQAAMGGVMCSNLAVNVMLSGSLNQLFSMLESQQFVVHLPLMNVTFPENAAHFYDFLISVSTFDILPTDKIFDNLFHYNATSDRRPQTMLLYDSNLFIRNLGTPFILCLLIILVVLVLYLVDAIAKVTKRQRIRRWVERSKKKIFFNLLLQFSFESYMLFAVCSALMINRFNWSEAAFWTSCLATIVFITYICVLPVLTGVWLYRNYERLEEPAVLEKYSYLYSHLALKRGRLVLVIPVIYQLRRLLFVFSLTNGDNMPVFQVLNVMYQIFLIMVLYVHFNPFEDQLKRKLDVFNECCILICTYSILLYTDIVADERTKFNIGWAMIVATTLNILINIILMLKQSLALLINKCKERWAKRKKGVPVSATVTANVDESSLQNVSEAPLVPPVPASQLLGTVPEPEGEDNSVTQKSPFKWFQQSNLALISDKLLLKSRRLEELKLPIQEIRLLKQENDSEEDNIAKPRRLGTMLNLQLQDPAEKERRLMEQEDRASRLLSELYNPPLHKIEFNPQEIRSQKSSSDSEEMPQCDRQKGQLGQPAFNLSKYMNATIKKKKFVPSRNHFGSTAAPDFNKTLDSSPDFPSLTATKGNTTGRKLSYTRINEKARQKLSELEERLKRSVTNLK